MAPKATMPVHVRGVTYATAHEAAAALGVSLSQVYGAVCRGRTETLGIGKGRHGNHKPVRPHAVKIGPLEFASKRQAAETLRISRTVLSTMDRDPVARERAVAAALRHAYNAQREESNAREP